jgi:Bacterial PH domain
MAKETTKYFSDQFDDEEMLLLFRKHPVVMRKAIVIGSVLLLLGTLPALVKPTYAFFFGGLAVGLLLFTLVMFYSWIGWNFSVYIVTDQRFIQITQKGLWSRSMIDIGLDKISTISYEVKGLQETLLGFGTIVIQTYVGELVIHDVHHPKKIQKQMSHILRDLGLQVNAAPVITDKDS